MTGKDYTRKNSATIANALGAFQKAVDDRCFNAMQRMCQMAMKFALENHDEYHQKHIEIGDSYGWIVLKDKVVVASGVNSGTELSSIDFDSFMRNTYPLEVPDGWVGVIVAGMGMIGYFAVDFEQAILYNTQEYVRSNFKSLIKL